MKGHVKKRASGGMTESGAKEYEADVKDKPTRRNNAPDIESEAEARKSGGRAKRKSGGVVHHEKMSEMKHAKHVGKVHGTMDYGHAGRKPRKSGGRAACEASPFSAAAKGEMAKAHRDTEID